MAEPAKRERAIFEGMLELTSVGERKAYLSGACGDDAELRERVESLIRANDEAGGFLPEDDPNLAAAAGGRGRTSTLSPVTEKPGDRIGRYKLREKVGEGGCGVVYVAEQEEPVRRRVALKVIKLGMDTKSVIARFEAERQALAIMDHPNVAKVLDAGATETGRPYFVMELVRGIKITEYCDQNKLSTRERLDLFIKVCQAVQHAHQKGIIHRDIKPSNILVTLHDGVPVPKIIDFGIAKATEGRLTDLTVYTQLHEFIGTPAYMSPEQAEMSGLDIDTRSDIYSLGVLLYELLAGRTPFDAKELREAGLDEMRRTIREKEPVRPSTRLSTLQAADQTEVARRRSADPPRLVKLLRGDLDWIVMKALEKDRTRRYETANAFAQDIRRHLADEPVSASAPSARYRFGKFARRNKTALTVAAAIAAILVLATLASTWQAIRATRAEELARQRVLEVAAERDQKEMARQEAEAISTFLTEVFQSPDPEREGRTITVAETLDAAARNLDTLAHQPARRVKLQTTLGKTYHALGLYRDAIPLLEKARDYYLATLGPEHPDTLSAMNNLANSYDDAGRQKEAFKLREEVLALRRKVLGPEHPDTLLAMHYVAISYHHDTGRREEALKLREQVLALCRKVLGPGHPETLLAMHYVANSYYDAGRREEAFKLREEVLALRRKVLGPEHPETLRTLHNLSTSYFDAGRREEAFKLYKEVLALRRKVNGPEHPETLKAMESLAGSYFRAGRREEAFKVYEEVFALRRKVNGPEHPDTLSAMNNLAGSYFGPREEALKLREETLALCRKVLGPEHQETVSAMHNLAVSYFGAGRREEALKLREQVVALRRPEHQYTLLAMNNLAISYFDAGRREEALKVHEEALALSRKVSGPEHPNTLLAMNRLANSYFDAGRREEALKLREELLALRRKVRGPEHPNTLLAMNTLANSYFDAGRREEALKLREELLALRRKVSGPEDPETLLAMRNLVLSFSDAGIHEEAVKLQEEVLALRRKAHGPEHPNALFAMRNLALSYQNAGMLNQAVPLFEDLFKIQQRLDDPDALSTMDYLTRAHADAGSPDSAEAFYREQLAQNGSGLASLGLGRLLLERAKSDTQNPSRAEERTREGEGLVGEYLATARGRYTNDPTKLERSIHAVAEVRYRQGNYAAAEPLLRECLAIRLRGTNSADWRTGEVKSRLGGALVSLAVADSALNTEARAAKLAEAETLLLQGNEQLQRSGALEREYKRDALERLVRLYEARAKPEKLSEWQQKLEEFRRGETKSSKPAEGDRP